MSTSTLVLGANRGDERVMTEIATFGAGCFWHVEETLRHVKGVVGTTVGYSGGDMQNPTYRDVCSGQTHHAEVVRVEYDPSQVSYDDLLNLFWELHDPTTLNRQGPDVGEQYRSVIFYHNDSQKAAAEASLARIQKSESFKNRKIVTWVLPSQDFYRAEEYHQRYLEKRGMHQCRYC